MNDELVIRIEQLHIRLTDAPEMPELRNTKGGSMQIKVPVAIFVSMTDKVVGKVMVVGEGFRQSRDGTQTPGSGLTVTYTREGRRAHEPYETAPGWVREIVEKHAAT